MRVLCVAEKPSQAKEIANKLSDGQASRRNGRDKYCKNYDFTFIFRGQRCEFVVTSLIGHVQGLDFDSAYRKWNSCPPGALFELPVTKVIAEDKLKVVENLQNEARMANILMIWTDCDREGENIGAEAAQLAGMVNRNLQVYRAKFSVMQARELKAACLNPGQLDMRLVDAVDARAEVDLRIGAALTRLQTLSLQSAFPSLSSEIISYGSCQFPTLGFIVDRFIKIRDFVPEEFYRINMSYERDGLNIPFRWKRGVVFDQMVCLNIFQRCLESSLAKVVEVTSQPTSKWRPLPLTTVELQKMGSKYLRMSSDKVMEAANNLYQKGFISYPRTETDQFDDSMELLPLVEKQLADPRWQNYSQSLVSGGAFQLPRKGKNNDKSHPPIHPTAAALTLEGDEAKVYEFVTRRFLAACSKDARGLKAAVEVAIADERFVANGLTVLEHNYLEIYPYDKWSDKELARFTLHETFMPSAIEMEDGQTSPPSLLTESELITIMSRNGIGTDATIHEHISKVLKRKYVTKVPPRQLFKPCDLGVGLVEGYDQVDLYRSLSKPHLRREFEHSLVGICEGTKQKDNEVRTTLALYFNMFQQTLSRMDALIQSLARYFTLEPNFSSVQLPNVLLPPPEPVTDCPTCKRPMTLRNSNGKCYVGCSGYPTCRTSVWFPLDKFENFAVTQQTCTRCVNQRNRGSVNRLIRLTVVDYMLQNQLGEIYSVCIRCDEDFGLLTNMRLLPSSENNNSRTSVGRNQLNATFPRTVSTPRLQNVAYNNASNNIGFGGNSTNSTNEPNNNFPPRLSSSANIPDNSIAQYREMMLSHGNDGPNQAPQCHCSMTAITRVKTRSGANQGQSYYTCSKASRPCGFFSWVDTSLMSNRSSTETQNYPDSAMASVTCFRCQQPGHYASNCPQQSNSNYNAQGQRGTSTNSTRTRAKAKKSSYKPRTKNAKKKGPTNK